MSHLLDEVLAQAANGSPATVALSSESVAVLLFASEFIERRSAWEDKIKFPLDEVTDDNWDTIEKLVGNVYYEIMTPLLGMIYPTVLTTLPPNMLPCDGSSYLREDYPDLYAILPAVFIVDEDNFITPDLRGTVAIGIGEAISGTTYTMGQMGGSETETLEVEQIPPHTHTDTGHFHTSDTTVPSPTLVGEIPSPLGGSTSVPTVTGTASANLTDTGGGEAHNNLQPYTALNYAMVAR